MGNSLQEGRWIHQTSLLWRTRGKVWDHAFLMLPSVQPKIGWYKTYKAIIALCPESKEKEKLYDRIFRVAGDDGDDILVSVGTICDDRLDISGRTIRHTFFYVLPKEISEEKSVPLNWVKSLWNLIDVEFSAPYENITEPNLDTWSLHEGFEVSTLPFFMLPIVEISDLSDNNERHSLNKGRRFRIFPAIRKIRSIYVIPMIFILATSLFITSTFLIDRGKSIPPETSKTVP